MGNEYGGNERRRTSEKINGNREVEYEEYEMMMG